MSGSDMTDEEMANEVFHAMHPECPAYPGIPNLCHHAVCDCWAADDLPGQVTQAKDAAVALNDVLKMTGPVELHAVVRDAIGRVMTRMQCTCDMDEAKCFPHSMSSDERVSLTIRGMAEQLSSDFSRRIASVAGITIVELPEQQRPSAANGEAD